MTDIYVGCTHPDHVDGKDCLDHCIGCSKHCKCCVGDAAVPVTAQDMTDKIIERNKLEDELRELCLLLEHNMIECVDDKYDYDTWRECAEELGANWKEKLH